MTLRMNGFEFEIGWREADKIIEKELNKLSKEDLIKLLMDYDKEKLDLEEYFRDEITNFYEKEIIDNINEPLDVDIYGRYPV